MRRSYLIINFSYSPMMCPQAFRWSMLAQRWAEEGHRVDVIAGLEDDLPAEERLGGVNVFRVNNGLFERIRRKIKSCAAQQSVRPPNGWVSPKRWLVSLAHWSYYTLWARLYWPDSKFLWYSPALRKARQLAAEHDYDVLITASPFFAAHLVGEKLWDSLPASCWLLDCGDPFSFMEVEPYNNATLYGHLNQRTERQIFRKARAISVTTRLTREIYASKFPESADKIEVIPPLLSTAQVSAQTDWAPGQALRGSKTDISIRMIFSGMLYPNLRPPDFLLKLFAGLMRYPDLAERLELNLYGDISKVRKNFDRYEALVQRGKIILHGSLSRDVVVQAIEEADILVNIGNRTAYQLPSKVIEYASTGKPILNLMQIAEDSSETVFRTYPAALNLLSNGNESLEEQIEILHQWINHLPQRLSYDFVREWLAPYQLDTIIKAYNRLIQQT